MSLTRYTLRQLPGGVLVASALVGAAWAVATRLDTTFERTVLAAVTTIGLSLVCTDTAHAMTAASPTPLRRRRSFPVLVAASAMFAAWAVEVATAGLIQPAGTPVGWWDVMQWVVVASSQIAVGALTAVRRRDDPLIAPGAFTAALWCAFTAGSVHRRLYEVSEHRVTWIVLGFLFVATTGASWADPAVRRPRAR